MHHYSYRSIGVCLAIYISSLSVAQADITGSQVLKGLNVTPAEVAQLENGKVLTFSDEAYENTKRELSADAVILVDSDLDALMNALTEEATIVPSHVIFDYAVIKSEADFSGVKFTEAEYAEVEDLFKAKAGNDFNFSNSEYALLQEKLRPHRNSDPAGKIAAASDAIGVFRVFHRHRRAQKRQQPVEGCSASLLARDYSSDNGL